MTRKTEEKTTIQIVSDKISKILTEHNCNLYAVPRFVPAQNGDKLIWEMKTDIRVLEVKEAEKDAKKAKSK